jgi:hypothetical protein
VTARATSPFIDDLVVVALWIIPISKISDIIPINTILGQVRFILEFDISL